ncbi:MAG: hypothetical protein HNEKOMLI_00431 [Sodalis sp. Psp]|nr:hypothetical protein [Sodalis sp. Psp]MCR3756908.1 hypothetical protein [Sodalis sp. Ppy]
MILFHIYLPQYSLYYQFLYSPTDNPELKHQIANCWSSLYSARLQVLIFVTERDISHRSYDTGTMGLSPG